MGSGEALDFPSWALWIGLRIECLPTSPWAAEEEQVIGMASLLSGVCLRVDRAVEPQRVPSFLLKLQGVPRVPSLLRAKGFPKGSPRASTRGFPKGFEGVPRVPHHEPTLIFH